MTTIRRLFPQDSVEPVTLRLQLRQAEDDLDAALARARLAERGEAMWQRLTVAAFAGGLIAAHWLELTAWMVHRLVGCG